MNRTLSLLIAALTIGVGTPIPARAAQVNVDGDAVGVPLRISPAEADREWAWLKSFVPALNRVWTGPSLLETVDTVHAPVLGNGHLVGCMDGGQGFVSYYLRTTDFWTDDSEGKWGIREIPAAHLRISEHPGLTHGLQRAWASSEHTGNESAGHAFDGMMLSKWCSESTGTHWLAVDLGRELTIRRWVVHHCGAAGSDKACNTRDFKLQKSDDGEAWTDVDAVTGNTEDVTDRNTRGFKSRYVRLFILRPTSLADDNHARIHEFSVFSEARTDADTATVSYRQEEDILDAEVRSDMPMPGGGLRVVSWIAATENTLVARVTNHSGKAVRLQAQLSNDMLDRVDAYPAKASAGDDFVGYTRTTNARPDARWIARLGFALRVFGASEVRYAVRSETRAYASFSLPPGATATVVTCVSGGKDAAEPLAQAVERVRKLDPDAVAALQSAHRAWWRDNWWLRSFVRTHDDTIDAYYFRMLYQFGTMCREGGLNSGLHGAWKASDNRHNYSSYCLNELGAAQCYLPLIMANRPATAKMWVETVHGWMPEGRRRAEAEGLRGIYFPVHIGPWGSTYEPYQWGQKFLAAYASIVGNWYVRDTGDKGYLESRVYPFMKGCADFYESWLKKESDGKYHVKGSSYEELTDDYWNSCLDLALAHILFTDIITYSEILGIDAGRRAKWADIRDNLNPYTTAIYNGKTVYLADRDRPFNHSRNVIQTQIIFPGYACNRFSDPQTREIGYNTLVEAAGVGGWDQGNMVNQRFYVALLRIGGFDVNELMEHFRKMLVDSKAIDFPVYIGSATLWDFNQQLCVQAYREGLMFFPEFPKDRRAVFARIRLPGAFLASGEFADGQPGNLGLYSELGNPCTVIGPWGPDVKVRIIDDRGQRVTSRRHDGDRHTFVTEAGRTYRIERM